MIKKQLIMEKALELFAEQGIEATSVQQITDRCGISKGAFYLSFKSKDELVTALIDRFMMQYVAHIDSIVRTTQDDKKLLYSFFYSSFRSFYQYSDFAKVLIKEQIHSFNEELISKLRHYDRLSNKIMLTMVERVFGDAVKHTKYDLVHSIKGFMGNYMELALFYTLPLDFEALSRSLVEKVNILAMHIKTPFITEDWADMLNYSWFDEVTLENLSPMIVQSLEELPDGSIEKESLELLKQQLVKQTYPPAIIKGLIENIHQHPRCKWTSYVLRRYFNFDATK